MPTAVTQQEQPVHFLKPTKLSKPLENSDEVWSRQSIEALFNLPFNDLLFKAQQNHREHFNPNEVQLSTVSLFVAIFNIIHKILYQLCLP